MSEHNTNKNDLRDPVCGMTVTETAEYHYEYKGNEYWFCCSGCLDKFRADPEQYLKKKGASDCCCHAH